MTQIQRLADALAAAHRSGELIDLDPDLKALPVDDAPAVQVAVMQLLGETAAGSKVAINKEGRAVVAPLLGSRFVESGASLPLGGATGLEVEIALRLRRDLTPELARDESALLSAIDAFYVGVELIGSRLRNHREAGLGTALADNLVGNGYAINSVEIYPGGADISKAMVTVEIDGTEVHQAPALNPFGSVLAALAAYARAPFDAYGALRAGHIITTGTLCGVIPISGPCSISARVNAGPHVSLTLD